MPPFGGADELDHAFRAAATARGEWVTTPAARHVGAWLVVPQDIVAAAGPECQARPYTTADDCVGTVRGENVRVASGAGRYHPVFYAVVGTLARPFQGVTALYVMRIVTATLCLGLLALGLIAVRSWARTRTAFLGVVVSCSPVVVYSCSIVSPNGLEILAGLGFWAAAVGLLTAREDRVRRLSIVAAITGATLCTLRPLGPFWCCLVAGVVLAAVRADPGRIRLLRGRRDIRIAPRWSSWALSKGSPGRHPWESSTLGRSRHRCARRLLIAWEWRQPTCLCGFSSRSLHSPSARMTRALLCTSATSCS